MGGACARHPAFRSVTEVTPAAAWTEGWQDMAASPQCAPMEAWISAQLGALMNTLAVPQVGLPAVFVIAFVSATLLPLGSEPAVYGLVKLDPGLFWPAILVATVGNTLGGMVSWWMGYGAERLYEKVAHRPAEARALQLLQRLGPKACLLAWLPLVGDPLCAVAGWLRLPPGPCMVYMAIGKFLRYLAMTAGLLWLFPGGVTP
jgi:membrane protein YqaA with SNARE-associated domain